MDKVVKAYFTYRRKGLRPCVAWACAMDSVVNRHWKRVS